MKLHIKNLGPIKEATIDLSKRFYTFVGYNNSGKTYLANLLTGVFHQYRGLKFSNIVLKSILISDEDIINKRFVVTQKDIHSILPIYADYLKNEFLPEILNISKESPIIKKLSIAFLDVNINIKDLIYIGDRVNFNFKDVFTEIKEDRIVFNNINYDRKMHHSWESVIVYKLIQDLDLIDVSWNIDFLPTERLSFMTFYKYFYKVEQLRREEIGDF